MRASARLAVKPNTGDVPASEDDSYGTACRNRRISGPVERLHRGRQRQDCEGKPICSEPDVLVASLRGLAPRLLGSDSKQVHCLNGCMPSLTPAGFEDGSFGERDALRLRFR
jgi:hypothetical protein